MNEKVLRIPFNAPLNKGDTEVQTYGCRQNNPDICGNNGLAGTGAFEAKIESIESHLVHGKEAQGLSC